MLPPLNTPVVSRPPRGPMRPARSDRLRRRVRAHVLALAALFALTSAAPARSAQPTAPQPGAPPPPDLALALFDQLERWIRDWAVPDQPTEPLAAVGGASVTLRLDGSIVGRGTDVTADGLSLWRAASIAWQEARQRLPVARDALRDQQLRLAARRMTISLELCGQPVPLRARSADDLVRSVEPGVHGVQVRLGAAREAVFPGAMVLAGLDPVAAARAALASSRDARIDPGELIDPRSPRSFTALLADGTLRVDRLEVVWLVQHEPGAAPRFVLRGARVVGLDELHHAGLRRWADDMALYLLRAQHEASTGLRGTLHPLTGRWAPPVAAPDEQALAAIALLRYASAPHVDPTRAHEARHAAITLLRAMSQPDEGQAQPGAEAAWAGLCLGALAEAELELPRSDTAEAGAIGDDLLRLADRCRDSLVELLADPAELDRLDGSRLAAVAWGLAAWARARDAEPVGDAARSLIVRLYRTTPPEQLVALMPWLGWADRLTTAAGQPVPSAIMLREWRALVWAHALGPGQGRVCWPDEQGAIVFAGQANAEPDWQTARPVALVATMLAWPEVTDPTEQPLELARLLDALRFLRQLTADETVGHLYRSAEAARGGVRAALWDHRMPPAATALTLLAVSETLRSLERMAASAAVSAP